jgi:hypothetical protein
VSTEQRDKAARDYADSMKPYLVQPGMDLTAYTYRVGWDAHTATMPDEKALVELLNSPQHAPMETHDRDTGKCIACPVPLHVLSPYEIADAVLALLKKEGGE